MFSEYLKPLTEEEYLKPLTEEVRKHKNIKEFVNYIMNKIDTLKRNEVYCLTPQIKDKMGLGRATIQKTFNNPPTLIIIKPWGESETTGEMVAYGKKEIKQYLINIYNNLKEE